MFNDNEDEFLPPREEEIPERLAKRWEDRERREGLIACPACGKQILAASSFCAYCGEPVALQNRRWLVWIAVFMLLILLLWGARTFLNLNL